jgi:hypothetical protein
MSTALRAVAFATLLSPWVGRVGDAAAQAAPPIPPVPVGPGEADAFKGMAGGDLGFGRIGGDYYLRLNLGTELDFGKVGVGIQVPLNFRLSDRTRNGDTSLNTTLRKEDWDEVADYARIIRYFRYGHPSDTFYVRIGELYGATIGHGTIVNSYYNSINLDIYKLGVQLNVNTDFGGVQTLMDNLFQPSLFGARVYVRPVAFFDKDSYANNLAIGLTVMADAFAPTGVIGPMQTSAHEPSVANDAAAVMGVDIEFAVVRSKVIDVIPYTDLNHIFGASNGWHLGVLTKLRPLEKLGLNFRLEYRYLSDNYIPGYFDSYYDIQRYTFPLGCPTPITKLDYVRGQNRPAMCAVGLSGSGFYGEGVFSFFDILKVIMAYEDAEGPNNSNLLLSLQLPYFDALKLAAYYYKRNFDSWSDAFSTDNAVLIAEARIRMYAFLYFIARYARSWVLSADGKTFASTDDFSVGIGMAVTF